MSTTTQENLAGRISAATLERLQASARAAVGALSSLQRPDGHWCAELEGDSILQSEYILMKWILRQERAPLADGRGGWDLLQRLASQLRAQQRPDGGWGQYPGSGIDVSATVKGYLCLKLMGDDPSAPHMARARERVLELGGAEKCNSFTTFYLAALGQVPWDAVPAIPPEVVWLPRWFYFHLDKVSAWSRTMILPLAIVNARRPARELAPHQRIDELYVSLRARRTLRMREDTPALWKAFFRTVDRTLKLMHRFGLMPWRERAIADAFQWIMRRASQDMPAPTEGLGAIFPPMVYLQVVFQVLGIPREDPRVQRAERDLDAFIIDGPRKARIQPCFSPVWDTGIALYALTDCGLDARDPSLARAAQWLVGRECRHLGDWVRNCAPGTAAGGWYFEYSNAWYPDCDDTAMVAMALRRCGDPQSLSAARRGVRWMLAMQNDDGGWAAFDRTKDRHILEYVPFADHNAMQDPSCPDITGRVLECLSWHGMQVGDAVVDRAIDYIRSHQEPDGSFFGRWGVNYIYGTWQAVIGPIRCGVPRDAEWISRAGAWVKSVQKSDGSFGETANSYMDPGLRGTGPSTASQTAWGAMILQEVYGPEDPDLVRALEWLAHTQLDADSAARADLNPDGDPAGSWRETEFTGTGFPKVFYLRYHLYRLYFPVMAIGRFLQAHGRGLMGCHARSEAGTGASAPSRAEPRTADVPATLEIAGMSGR
jgi:squalene-hopene/tetraprenyl-beta-curcumene cyclase